MDHDLQFGHAAQIPYEQSLQEKILFHTGPHFMSFLQLWETMALTL
jgi:hypothetical protein